MTSVKNCLPVVLRCKGSVFISFLGAIPHRFLANSLGTTTIFPVSLHNKAGQAFGLSGLIFVIHSSLTSETVGKSCLFSGFLSYFLELIKAYGLLVKAHSLFNSVVEF